MDKDSDVLKYSWRQISGQPVSLSNASSSSPTFFVSSNLANGSKLVFKLLVSDQFNASDNDTVTFTVMQRDQAPLSTNNLSNGITNASSLNNSNTSSIETPNITMPKNSPPVATIEPQGSAVEGDRVTLNGSGS